MTEGMSSGGFSSQFIKYVYHSQEQLLFFMNPPRHNSVSLPLAVKTAPTIAKPVLSPSTD